MSKSGARNLKANVAHRSCEKLSVFAAFDRIEVTANDLDVLTSEHACLAKSNRTVKRRLAAHIRKQGIRMLALYDL